MTRPRILFAPAGEVGTITQASVASAIERGVAAAEVEVDFAVDFRVVPALEVDLAAVGAGSVGVARHSSVGVRADETTTTSDATAGDAP